MNAVDELPSAWPTPAGAVDRPSRLGEILPVALRTDGEIAADLQRMSEIRSALAAFEAELVVELAGRRPASAEVPVGRSEAVGLPAYGADDIPLEGRVRMDG